MSKPTPRPGPARAKQLCLGSSVVCAILLQERGWQAIRPPWISHNNPGPPPPHSDRDATLSLDDAPILAVTERLGCMVLTRDGYRKWMVDEGHLKVQVAIP